MLLAVRLVIWKSVGDMSPQRVCSLVVLRWNESGYRFWSFWSETCYVWPATHKEGLVFQARFAKQRTVGGIAFSGEKNLRCDLVKHVLSYKNCVCHDK